MPIEKAWPSLLSQSLENKGKSVTVVNASISGDTSGNGLMRLPSLLKLHKPDTVLIELGANDGLRGFPLKVLQSNLSKIVQIIREGDSKPILMQIRVLPNYGKRYTEAFSNTYPKVAQTEDVPLIPFFLEQVVTKPEWMMQDGLHPTEQAQPWIAEFVAEELYQYL